MNKIEQLIKKIINDYCDEVVIDVDENGIFFVATLDGYYEDGQTLEEALENFGKRYCKW